jgi:hypothetical protein
MKIKKYVITNVPKTYKGRVNWYVSHPDRNVPIHCFDTQAQAIDWCDSQPQPKYEGMLDDPIYQSFWIDWFTYGGNPRKEVTATRQIIDHRDCIK